MARMLRATKICGRKPASPGGGGAWGLHDGRRGYFGDETMMGGGRGALVSRLPLSQRRAAK